MQRNLSLFLAVLYLTCVDGFVIGKHAIARVSSQTSLRAEPLSELSEPPPVPPVLCPNCDKCDGSGRIMGGLGAFPLTSWWPIKAYRPCPNFSGEYRRSGQSLDEIAFGRERRDD